jgi:hypothetical protein
MVVATTAVLESSSWAHAGSLGWVPLSRITSQFGAVGADDPNGIDII